MILKNNFELKEMQFLVVGHELLFMTLVFMQGWSQEKPSKWGLPFG